MKWSLACLVAAGCASAGPGNSIIGGITDDARTDAGDVPEPDASVIDAPPQQITLTQTTSTVITGGNSISCIAGVPDTTRPNSYFRVFTLADENLTTTLHVSEVMFGIQDAVAGVGGMQPAKLRLGTYGAAPAGDTLDLSQVRSISSVDIQIPDGHGTRMTVPISADLAPTSRLIVELAIPASSLVRNQFFIGSNTQGERHPGYLQAPTCGLSDPATFRSVAAAGDEVDIVMTVTGMR